MTFHTSSFPYTIIAGPCSAESEEQVMQTASELHNIGIRCFRAGLWKPRTRPGGFEGVGEKGIPWMLRVQKELGMEIATEVATPEHVFKALNAGIRILWVGARTTSSPFAIEEIAKAIRATNLSPEVTMMIKNPVNPDVNLWIGALMRFHDAGLNKLVAIHRGFSTYGVSSYRNPPHWQIPLDLKRQYPDIQILVDPSHITGRSELVSSVCQLALDMQFDGLIVETHIHPQSALSDSRQQIKPQELDYILKHLYLPTGKSHSTEGLLISDRTEIDQIDEQIIELLAERQRVCMHIGDIKKKHQMPVVQPERFESSLKKRKTLGERYRLSPAYIEELWNIIHEESIKAQKDENR